MASGCFPAGLRLLHTTLAAQASSVGPGECHSLEPKGWGGVGSLGGACCNAAMPRRRESSRTTSSHRLRGHSPQPPPQSVPTRLPRQTTHRQLHPSVGPPPLSPAQLRLACLELQLPH